MKIKMAIKERKDLNRRKYIKLQIQIYEEKKRILKSKLEDTCKYIKNLWIEFEELKEQANG